MFDAYVVDGTRIQHGTEGSFNAFSGLIRSNISITHRFIVTENTNLSGFRFIRIPVNNWTTTTAAISVSLSVVGSGASIDGAGSSKSYASSSTVNKPSTGRYSGSLVNDSVARQQYDITTVTSTPALLTPGVYSFTYLTSAANTDMAMLYKSMVPIVETGKIYYDSSSALNNTYSVIELLGT